MEDSPQAAFVRRVAAGETARRAVLTLCQAIAGGHPAAVAAMERWTALFGRACGRDLRRPSAKVSNAARCWADGAFDGPPQTLLLALHTYYAMLVKAIVAQRMPHASDAWTSALGDDLFSWPAAAGSSELERLAGEVSALAAEGRAAALPPDGYRGDLLRDLYQELLPRPLRHELGEYYTPDWLAEHVLDQVGYTGDPRQRLLDPACGSGTFLLAAIRRIRARWEASCEGRWVEARDRRGQSHFRWGENRDSPRNENWDSPQGELCRTVLANVVGCDINPVAVLAARANFLLALGDLLDDVGPVAPPVVLGDSIFDVPAGPLAAPFDFVVGNPPWIAWDNLPADYRRATQPLWEQYGLFSLSATAARHGGGKKDLAMLMIYAAAERYLKPCDAAIPAKETGDRSQETGDRSQEYEVRGTEYGQSKITNLKSEIAPLPDAGETPAPQPRLGMVLTQTAFQTKGAGDGFRRFRLGSKGVPLRVLRVDDMAAIKPFPEAANWTATLVLEKGAATQYPVPYFKWTKEGDRPDFRAPTEHRRGALVGSGTKMGLSPLGNVSRSPPPCIPCLAEPIEPGRPGAPWFVRPPGLKVALASLVGPSDYTAHLGANSGGANGVYWLEVLARCDDGVLVRNIAAANRHGVPQIEQVIEPDLLYPLLRWGDVAPFAARPSAAILLAQDCTTRTGIDPAELERRCPRTLAYLRQFEDLLRSRAAYRRYQDRKPFYSMYNVGPYTAAPLKVVWRRMDRRIRAAAVEEIDDPLLGRRPVVPQETCVLVAVESADEAHYVCAVLNGAVAGFLVAAHSVGGGKGFGTPSILDYVRLRRFDPRDRRHAELASLGRAARAEATAGKLPDGLQAVIDRLAAELWGLDAGDRAAIEAAMGR